MSNFYPIPRWALCTGLLLAPVGAALAQAPVITSVIPMANARATARNSPVTVNFSQPLTAASAGALKVFSSQRGGLRSRGTTPAVVSGNTLSFAPTNYDFRPGETVQYTVTTAAAGSSGALGHGRVGQFTAAVGGAGNGNFQLGSTPSVGGEPTRVLTGDVDGDGDLDLVTTLSNSSYLGIRLNNGTGSFSGNQYVAIPNPANSVGLGDVDGDGDLDLVAATNPYNVPQGAMSVRLNDGSGTFGSGSNVGIISPTNLTLGDLDGDGDLDLAVINGATNTTLANVQVSIRLNNGNGTFSNSQDLPATGAEQVVLTDTDNDGDLDLVVLRNTNSGVVSVWLNTGTGTFVGNSDLSGFDRITLAARGDLDGDGDADMVATAYGGPVYALFNDGGGIFRGVATTTLGGGYTSPLVGGTTSIALGDVDGDGDLDLVGTNTYSQNAATPPGKVGIRLNNGQGVFSGGLDVAVLHNPFGVAMGDVDGDGDLDIIATSTVTNSGKASVLLNQPGLVTAAIPAAAAPALALFPNPTHGAVALTGATPNAPLTVLDALGRVLLTATADATGTARLALPAGLPAGVYLVRSGGQVRRLAVE